MTLLKSVDIDLKFALRGSAVLRNGVKHTFAVDMSFDVNRSNQHRVQKIANYECEI